ncbi:MAG: hypothetical protein JWO82_1795 [Akkermansiaceae bacterium]|nr:hypothetical protein [Akkermansiaceae bacterium]
MHRLISLLGVLYLSSCAGRMAESPLRDSTGTPMVIRIPKVPKGSLPRPVDVMAIDAKLFANSSRQDMIDRQLPELKGTGRAAALVDGLTGEVKTLRGEVFHAYFPLVKVQAVTSQERANAAANGMAAELYLEARKNYQLYPMTGLAVR